MTLQIINQCPKLPSFALWHIRKSREWIPPFDLVGIEFIRLLDKLPEIYKEEIEKRKTGYSEEYSTTGMYIRKTTNYPAEIQLYIRNIYCIIPRYAYFSPVPTLIFSGILAHEVAHHLVRTKGYIFTPDEKYPLYEKKPEFEEEMANRYAFGIVKKMKEKLLYRFGIRMLNEISNGFYVSAMMKWKDGNYKEAADCWYKSLLLNSERTESAEWYRNAKIKSEMILKNKDAPE